MHRVRDTRRAWLGLSWALVVLLGLPAALEARPPAGDLTLEEALAADWGAIAVEQITTMPESEKGGTAIVVLHGYGSSGTRYQPVGRALAGQATRVFLPTAVLPHPNGRGGMWWEFIPEDWPRPYAGAENGASTSAVAAGASSQQLLKARGAILELIERIVAEHAPEEIVLVGHSQGAMLAVDVAAASHVPIGRVSAVAGYVLEDSVANLARPRDARPVVQVVHGRGDSLVPFEHAERMRALLKASGYEVVYAPHDGGHGMGVGPVQTVQQFLGVVPVAPAVPGAPADPQRPAVPAE